MNPTIAARLLPRGMRLRGDLCVDVYSVKTRRRQRTHTIRNTITFNGVSGVLQLLKQDAVTLTNFQIAALKVGTSTTPPTRADTALGALVLSISLNSAARVLNLPTGELIVQAQLGPSDGNGHTLSEAGLFYANGSLFARQVHPGIDKTSAITVSYTWRLGITV